MSDKARWLAVGAGCCWSTVGIVYTLTMGKEEKETRRPGATRGRDEACHSPVERIGWWLALPQLQKRRRGPRNGQCQCQCVPVLGNGRVQGHRVVRQKHHRGTQYARGSLHNVQVAVPGARGLYLHWHCTTIHNQIHFTHPTPVPSPPSCASADNLALCPPLTNQRPLSTRSRCEITCGASRMQSPRGL